MDPRDMSSYVQLDSFSYFDQSVTPSHERQQQRDTGLRALWHPNPAFTRTPPPQLDLQTPLIAASPSNTADAPDVPLPSPQRVKRPRNAFMIFRSEFNSMHDKISRNVEHDNRHISRIVGHYWNQMSEQEKGVWRKRADQEKDEHMRKYPGYKFAPLPRTKKLKRNMKRNGDDEMERCRLVADLLLEGKRGDELLSALKASDPRDKFKEEEGSPDMISSFEEDRPLEQIYPYVLTSKPPLVLPNVDARVNGPSSSFMNAGANVGRELYYAQQVGQRPEGIRECYCSHYAVTPMPAMHDGASSAQFVDIDINYPMQMQSLYPSQSQYTMSPTHCGESYEFSDIQSEATYSHYSGANLPPPHVAHHPETRYSTKGRASSPMVTFRNPFANHQNHTAYVHSSPPPSPTDLRGFRGDPAVLRRWQDGV